MMVYLLFLVHILITPCLTYDDKALKLSLLKPSVMKPPIVIPKDPVYRRLQLKGLNDVCSIVTSDDDFIGGYFLDPCTGRITNMNSWRLSSASSKASLACPTSAPSSRTVGPQLTEPPTNFGTSTNTPSISSQPTLTPSSTRTKSPSLLLPLNPTTVVPIPAKSPSPSKAQNKSPTTLLPSLKPVLAPIFFTPSPSSQKSSPSGQDSRNETRAPTAMGFTTNPSRAPAPTITAQPTLPTHNGNNTNINPIGTGYPNNPKHFSNNNALALGLGLAAFVAVAFLISRRILIKKRASKMMDEDEDSISCIDPHSSQHIGDCHRAPDGTKWLDPSCPLCQETLLRRRAEEELATRKRMEAVDVHYCSSAICEKCHRPAENDVKFIKVARDEKKRDGNPTNNTCMDTLTMPCCVPLEEVSLKD